VAGALAVLSVAAVAPVAAVAADPPQPVTADVLPTVQIDGVVWAQTTVGNTVYVTGRFTSARPAGVPAGASETPRANILAYDLTTGTLITTFTASLNAEGLGITASPDGSRIYVVGNFTQADGVDRSRIAALDARTGALVPGFAPALDYRARTVTAVGSTVYVGGAFAVANRTARSRLAAFSAVDGSLLPWAPTADAEVFGLVVPTGGRVVAAGRFTTLNGAAHYGMGALDPTSGASLPWAATDVVRNAGTDAAIYSLATDGPLVYGTGYVFGSGGNLEGSFAADGATGALKWVVGCRGDVYSVQPVGGVVYSVGHPHDCSAVGGWPESTPRTFQRAMATTADARGTNSGGTFGGRPAPQLLTWWPVLDAGTFTGQSQAAWSVTGNGQYVSLGGEFPRVDGVAQQGLVRMAVRAIAPRKAGPRPQGDVAPQLTATGPGIVRVRWPTTWDPDDRTLEYRVVRDGQTATPVARVPAASTWWSRPPAQFADTGLAPGSTHTYRVVAYDPDGNATSSTSASTTLPAASAFSDYARTVLADGATAYWPLGGAGTATSAQDWAGVNDLTTDASVTPSSDRAIAGDPGTASAFAGTSTVPATTTTPLPAPSTFSVEAWIRTTTTRGGKVVGFGNSRTGASTDYDRHLYMTDAGRLVFGTYTGAVRTTTTAGAYDDGQWHHVVATVGGAGTALYVDGALAAQDAATTAAQPSTGYWRVGGDTLKGWPSAPTSNAFAGTVDEVAVYPGALSAATVADHWLRGTGTRTNRPPAASFTASAQDLAAVFDASGSTDPDGSVASYAWAFGDQTSGTGRTTAHTYATAGTYQVTLTVTDDLGATGTLTQPVTVTAPAGPGLLAQDTFTRTVTGGWGSADTGGPWSTSGGSANVGVAQGTGRLQAAAGATTSALLPGASSDDSDLRFSVGLDRAATGGGVYVTAIGRRLDAATDYRSTTKLLADGRVTVSLSRRAAGTETALGSTTVAGLTVAAPGRVQVRLQVTGTAPTTVRTKVWADGTAEPAAWLLSAPDTTAALQAPGSTGLTVYLSGSATGSPVVASFDDLLLRRGVAG